jgi:hypothetical protein
LFHEEIALTSASPDSSLMADFVKVQSRGILLGANRSACWFSESHSKGIDVYWELRRNNNSIEGP